MGWLLWVVVASQEDPLKNLPYPAERIELGYAILVHKAIATDPQWSKVVAAFERKYQARVFTYDVPDPAAAMKELIQYAPKYVAFIANLHQANRDFVYRTKAMMRALDEDPYEDAIWGIVTGYEAEDALRMARAEKLTVRKALSGIGGGWLEFFREGLSFSEGEKNAQFVKAPGKPVEKVKGPDDTTKSFADALNSDVYDMMSTSGHATEKGWQIGYSYENGFILSHGGKLFGRDTAGRVTEIVTRNPKIYFAPGNCLIGHISDMDCMALAWIHNGANQFYGHTREQHRNCRSWGIVDYFVRLQGRFTFAEAVLLNRADILFKGGNDCCESTVLYGDPAWEARVSAEVPPPYEASLKFEKSGGSVSITFAVTLKEDYEGPLALALLPQRIRKPEVKSVTENLKTLAIDTLVGIDLGKRKKGDRIEAVFSAELAPMKRK